VVIKGELGTELSTAAIAVHLGTLGDARLVILNCPALTPEMLERECGGQSLQHSSLFLQAADALSPAAQRALLSYLPAIPGSTAGPRLIASTTHDLEQMAREGSFLPELLAALDVLEIRIPPLRERQEDIGPIANHVLREHTQLHPSRKQVRHCHAELVALLCVHPWPGNVLELERTVLRLAVMADGEVLGVEHANRHARSSSLSDGTIETSSPAVVGTPEEWIEALVRMDHARFANVHEGLRRALIYIGEHYHEQVSLGPLAKSAFLSPSHLSYLLRTVVGTNFKTLLARLRIEHAKRLLGGDGQQQRVSDVAAAVGFGDLSHFEKTFRRFTAMSPREYRAAQSSTRPRR
jgi:DNA-binding NtrC family response regulator